MNKQTQNITIRLPAELHRKLAAAAATEHRSISSQVVHILTYMLPAKSDKEAAAGHDLAAG